MSEAQVKLACLKLAVEKGGALDDILANAQKFYDFMIKGGLSFQ